ncbi:ComF family protein [Pseudoscardovia suis]|uniref:ComF family protein n=2 Tax=Pseudoscardovia suis TaxID=987063 RepID=UPI001472E34B|nr:ComF family protein [Pseudoscardovia suis]
MSFVLFPRGCAGCDAPDEVLCRQCTEEFRQYPERPVSAPVRSGEVWACAWYRGSARQAVLRWKDHGDEEADAPLCALLRELVQHRATLLRRLVARSYGMARGDGMVQVDGGASAGSLARAGGSASDIQTSDVRAGDRHAGDRHADMYGIRGFPPILVVPVPSSAESKRARGRFQTKTLAKAVAAQLRVCVGEAVYADVLDLHGVSSKSVVASGRDDRAVRIRGRVRVKRDADLRSPVILVDDIVTSGATIRECAEVLHRHGADVVAVFTLASVPLRTSGDGCL